MLASRLLTTVAALAVAAFMPSWSAASVPIPAVEGPLADSATAGTLVWGVGKFDYIAEEYLIAGRADVYEAVAMADASNMLTRDIPKDMARRDDYARPVLKPAAAYVTRIIIYRPREPKRFSGTVVIETSHPLQGGLAIVWSNISGYFAQRGDIYISIAHPVTFDSLRGSNPVRYGRLTAVDPTQLWGMIAQTGALIKAGGATSPLKHYRIREVFLTGYSYTGVAAATFANFHHDGARLADGRHVFDGYLPMANSMYVRPIDVPVIRIMTQSDFDSFGGLNNRRPDGDTPGDQFRLWEVAGASHLNASPVIEPGADPWVAATALTEPPNLPHFSSSDCTRDFPPGFEPNTLPLSFVMVSAFEHLTAWVRNGRAPPRFDRLQTNPDGSLKTDANGNADGGLRLPQLTVPSARYGTAKGACFLYGYRLPFEPQRMTAIYGTPSQFAKALGAEARAQGQRGWLRPQEAQLIEQAAQRVTRF
jgi:hypothetical protein